MFALETLKIILLCILAAVVYGIVHDQVTARVCVEYFTIGHHPVFNTESPTLLAIGWGIIATWWAGAILGIPAALIAQVGSWPKFDARNLVRPVLILLAVMACSALVAGIVGYWAATTDNLVLFDPLASEIPASKHATFLADSAAHGASYSVGFLGGIVILAWILICRRRMASEVTG